jgi:NAD(P)-dependent dehydrogenase (short-subunit alcohol dehydrogenase family)
MKYALITGGTSGIGFAMAGEFLDRGYGVILASSSRKNLAIAKRKQRKTNPIWISLNVRLLHRKACHLLS